MQENIQFTNDGYVTGKSKYVTGFIGFSNKTAEQKGNYLAFKAEKAEGAEMSFKYSNNSAKGEVGFDDDMLAVVRVTDKNGSKGSIDIIAKKDGKSFTKTYNLDKLTLEPAEE